MLFKYPGDVLLWFVVFFFANAVHESAHALVSAKFGDYAGRHRITLNPLAHIDPLGSILFPLVGFMGAGFAIGWAKPFMATPRLWRDPRKANILVSAAGPSSNFFLAIIAFLIIKTLMLAGIMRAAFIGDGGPFNVIVPVDQTATILMPVATLLSIFLTLNIVLGILNFFPVPPLDGSHILESLLPPSLAEGYAQIRPYGFLLLIVLMYIGVFSYIIFPVVRLVVSLL